MKTGCKLIYEERIEQIEKHGWNPNHDKQHKHGELAIVAASLAVMHTDASVEDPGCNGSYSNKWGLEHKLRNDTIHALKVAGALIAAEIDRLLLLNPEVIAP
jgi:hypothetical protein